MNRKTNNIAQLAKENEIQTATLFLHTIAIFIHGADSGFPGEDENFSV